MSISTERSSENNQLIINVSGRFDFSSHQQFRKAYESENAKEYVVNLEETTYLDSSALGMLLLLRDYAVGEKASVTIINCNDDVRQIFAMSNFDQLFSIN